MAAAVIDTVACNVYMMSASRVPLANNPNAANSPLRGIVGKRQRSAAHDGPTEKHCSPAKKKQAVESIRASHRGPQPVAINEDDKRLVDERERAARRTVNPAQRPVAVARDSKQPTNGKQEQPVAAPDLEQIRLWRRHYRRVFPTLVFYLDGLSAEYRAKYSRQIAHLGAREESFFSRSVTHIVTARPVPPATTVQATRAAAPSLHAAQVEPNTINPTLLEKSNESQTSLKGRETLELVAAQRRVPSRLQLNDPQRAVSQQTDILQKARDLGMKIWGQEKFERMMAAMFAQDLADNEERAQTRANSQQLTRANKDADLSQLIRREKNDATINRNPWQEIAPFKGYYIYIHDMDERTRPVMVRQYDLVKEVEQGDWPQFRSCAAGRCPFVKDDSTSQVVSQRKAQAAKQEQVEKKPEPTARPRQTRAATAVREEPRPALADVKVEEISNTAETTNVPRADVFEAPKLRGFSSNAADSMPPLFPTARPNYRGIPGKPGGEPVASGIHLHPRTSAIQSNVPSSTAQVPGRRAGTTREMHQLQRRVMNMPNGVAGKPGLSETNQVRDAINAEPVANVKRQCRRPGPSTLTLIHEDEVSDVSQQRSVEESRSTISQPTRPATVKHRRTVEMKKAPKPGFCENCQVKYEDFEAHIVDEKHREFAVTDENWVDLDDLLQRLQRPTIA